VALHEDPGEEPFCSPTDAPVAAERYRKRRPAANSRDERRKNEHRDEPRRRKRDRRVPREEHHTAPPTHRTTRVAGVVSPPTQPLISPTDRYGPIPDLKERTERTLQPRTGSSLRADTARPTRSSEPILLPKVRIHFADFPYLH